MHASNILVFAIYMPAPYSWCTMYMYIIHKVYGYGVNNL